MPQCWLRVMLVEEISEDWLQLRTRLDECTFAFIFAGVGRLMDVSTTIHRCPILGMIAGMGTVRQLAEIITKRDCTFAPF